MGLFNRFHAAAGGFGFVDLLGGMVAAGTLATAMPAAQPQDAQPLARAAHTVETQLRQLRQHAVSRATATYIEIQAQGRQWRYQLSDGQRLSAAGFPGVALTSTLPGQRGGFAAGSGMAQTPGVLQLSSHAGKLHVQLHKAGPVTTCSPDGPFKIAGFVDCPTGS